MKKFILLVLTIWVIESSAQCTTSIIATYTPETCLGCCDGSLSFYANSMAMCAPIGYTIYCPTYSVTPIGGSLTGLCSGNYSIVARDGCACIGNCSIAITYNPTGIMNTTQNARTFSIYPNPVSNKLHIDSQQYFKEGVEIEIVNTLGQIILKLPFNNEIDVSQLPNGYYTLKICTDEKYQFHSKFIKE